MKPNLDPPVEVCLAVLVVGFDADPWSANSVSQSGGPRPPGFQPEAREHKEIPAQVASFQLCSGEATSR
jgi:hypothetical protein